MPQYSFFGDYHILKGLKPNILFKIYGVIWIEILGFQISNSKLFRIFESVLHIFNLKIFGFLGMVHKFDGGILPFRWLLKVINREALLEHASHVVILFLFVPGQIALLQSSLVVKTVSLVVCRGPLFQN